MKFYEFLNERLIEDETAIRAAPLLPVAWMFTRNGTDGSYTQRELVYHGRGEDEWVRESVPATSKGRGPLIEIYNPARKMAENGVLRMIVHDHRLECAQCATTGCTTMRFLANLYTGHPDFQKEWRA